MARNKNGLDLSGVGGRRLNVGGGSRPKPGLSFSNQPSLNSNRSQKVMPGSGQLSDNAYSNGSGGNRRLRLFIVLGVLLALAIAGGVGVAVYRYTIQNALKPTVDLSAAQSSLAAPAEDAVVWNLLLITQGGEDGERESVKEACVVAADASNGKLSYLWVPSSVRMYVAGYGYKSVAEAYDVAGIETYIQSFSDLTGITFNHVFVDSDKGIEEYLNKQNVDASYPKETIVSAVTKKLVDSGSSQLSSQVSLLQEFTATDMDSEALVTLLQSMSGLDVTQSLFSEEMPLSEEKTEEGYSQADTGQWATIVKRVGEGLDPVAGEEEIDENKRIRSSCRVTIWNGVGVSGIAGDCADHLKSKGWNLESTGNAASFVYDETLIVYNYDSERSIAELLVSDLGQGRAVRSAARYSFEGDVLVVVGKDYQPY